jgi:SAM-dependent methyltransferase
MAKISTLNPKDIQHNTKVFNEYIGLGMKDGWLPGNQLDNFTSLIKLAEFTQVPLQNTSVLDVGCGTGDLSKFLRAIGIKKYVGIDIYVPSLEQAWEKYPNESFIYGDVLTEIKQQFDYVFSSGALTVRQKTVDNYDFLQAIVSKMWEVSTVGIAFNFLTDEDPDPDPDLFFYNISQVLDICEDIDPNAQVTFEKTEGVDQAHVYMWR